MKNFFLFLGRVEGGSLLLLLFVAMPVKYVLNDPRYVQIIGPIHGGLFLAYVFVATLMSSMERWPLMKLLMAYILSCVPFGTMYFERKYLFSKSKF